jgi:hypothetical protein
LSENENFDPKRIRDMFWLFTKVIPFQQNKASKVFGIDFIKLIPDLSLVLANQCIKYPEDFNGYLEFIKQATAYLRGETDEYPNVGEVQEVLEKAMNKSIQEFNETAKPIKF